jgi:hypothetical protein
MCWLVAVLGGALLPALAAEDKPAPREAAEVVQEGDVSLWLEHYRRERGADWARENPVSQQEKPADPNGASQPAATR